MAVVKHAIFTLGGARDYQPALDAIAAGEIVSLEMDPMREGGLIVRSSKSVTLGRLTAKHSVTKCLALGQIVIHASIHSIVRHPLHQKVVRLRLVTGSTDMLWSPVRLAPDRNPLTRLVDERDYQPALENSVGMETAYLWHEPDNPNDPRALAATNSNGETIGYVCRNSWVHEALLDEGNVYTAQVRWIERGISGLLTCGLDVELTGHPVGTRIFEPSNLSGLTAFYHRAAKSYQGADKSKAYLEPKLEAEREDVNVSCSRWSVPLRTSTFLFGLGMIFLGVFIALFLQAP